MWRFETGNDVELARTLKIQDVKPYRLFALGKKSGFVDMSNTSIEETLKFFLTGRDVKEPKRKNAPPLGIPVRKLGERPEDAQPQHPQGCAKVKKLDELGITAKPIYDIADQDVVEKKIRLHLLDSF